MGTGASVTAACDGWKVNSNMVNGSCLLKRCLPGTMLDDIVLLTSNYREMQGSLEAVNNHATAVGMHISTVKTDMMLARVPDEQRHATLVHRKWPEH